MTIYAKILRTFTCWLIVWWLVLTFASGWLIRLRPVFAKDMARRSLKWQLPSLVGRGAGGQGDSALRPSPNPLSEGEGKTSNSQNDRTNRLRFSERFECKYDGTIYATPEPRLFSFNNPFGACPTCQGFGNTIGLDLDLVIPNPGLTLERRRHRAMDEATVRMGLDRTASFLQIGTHSDERGF